jgi:hypothetical protein
MKRLMTFTLIALLSFGVAAVSFAQEGTAGGQVTSGQTHGKATTKHKKQHSKKTAKKSHKKHAPAEEAK